MPRFIYSRQAVPCKPQGREVAAFQRKDAFTSGELSTREIAELCGTGHAWRAGIYDLGNGKQTFSKKEALGSQLIALDFDSIGQAPQELVRYAADIGLPFNFWYYSYSQDPKSAEFYCDYKNIYKSQEKTAIFDQNRRYKHGFNYRCVWVLERQISAKEYETIYPLLLDTFERYSPDKSTKDCSRLWFGGALGSEVLREEPLGLAKLGAISARAKVESGTEPRKALKQKKGFIPDYAEAPEPQAITVKGDWWEALRGRCYLWDEWEAGRYLDYNERLSLFSNLRYLKHADTSRSIVNDALRFFNPQTYSGHTCDEEQIRAKFRDCTLKPTPIVRGRGGERVTIPQFLADDISVPVLPKVNKVSAKELDEWLDAHIPQVLDDAEAGMKVLKSQTGSGKTERIIRWLLRQNLDSRRIIYAAPKHSNLKEVEHRLLARASFEQRGLIHRCPEKEITKQDLLLLSLGLPSKTKSAARKDFIAQLFDSDTKGVFLITHSLLTSLTNLGVDLIIIDEEIDSSLIRITKLSLSSLAATMPYLEDETAEKLATFIREVRDRDRKDGIGISLGLLKYEVAPQIEKQIDSYVDTASNLATGLFDVYSVEQGKLSTLGGMNCVRLTRRSPLIEESYNRTTPIRCFTATPMSKRTEHYYGVDVEVIEAPLASNEGAVIQYRGVSGAKGKDGENLRKLAEYIRRKLPQDVIEKSPLITFKATKEEKNFWESEGFNLAYAEDGNQIHLMNNSGLDLFKGHSIIVCGKWDWPQVEYQDEWDDIGDGSELVRQNQKIELNGISQTLYLFTEPQMRERQLETIRQAIEQTAGRARALRERGATVYVFANYVIGDADKVFD